MGDQQRRHRPVVADPADQVDHRRLGGDVERAGGLVGDQQRRPPGEGHGDHRPLAHAARQLVGVLPGHLRRPADLDGAQQPLDLGVALLAVDDAVDAQRLGELAADGAHRVEGGLGVLEHHRHPVAAQRPHLLGVAQVDVDAADAEAPVVELAVRRQQTHHGEAERASCPEPDSPTIAMRCPAGTVRSTRSRACTPRRAGAIVHRQRGDLQARSPTGDRRGRRRLVLFLHRRHPRAPADGANVPARAPAAAT